MFLGHPAKEAQLHLISVVPAGTLPAFASSLPATYYVYILECGDDSLYVGYTSDLNTRIRQHCDGRGGRYTAARLPVRMVYCQSFNNQTNAQARERQIKRWTRAKKTALIAGDAQLLNQLSPTPRRQAR